MVRDQQYRLKTEVPAQNMDRDQHRDLHRIDPHRIDLQRVPVQAVDQDLQYRPITEVPAQNMDRDQHLIDSHLINLHRIYLHRIAKLRGVQQGSGLGIGEAGDAGELVDVGGEAVANLTETLNLFIVS